MLKLCAAGINPQGQNPNVLLYTDPKIASYDFMLPFEEKGTYGTLGMIGPVFRERISGKELRGVLDSIAAHPCMTRGFVKGWCLSVVLYDSTADSTTAYQSVVQSHCAAPVLRAIQRALERNARAQTAVSQFIELTDLAPESLYADSFLKRPPSRGQKGDLNYFRKLSFEEMSRVEVKLTHLFSPARGMQSVLIADSLNPGHPELFAQFRTLGMDYGLDSLSLEKRFSTSRQQLKMFVEALSNLDITTSRYPAEMSLTLLDSEGPRACEILFAGDENGQTVFQTLLDAFCMNANAREWLDRFAVSMGLNTPSIPQETLSSSPIKN